MKKVRTEVWTWGRAVNSSSAPFTSTQKHVALTLSQYMSPAGDSCYPAMKTLAADSGLGVSTVRDALKRISEYGWLDRETVRGRGLSNQYLAVIPEYFDRHEDVDENRRRADEYSASLADDESEEPSEGNRQVLAVSEREVSELPAAENRQLSAVKAPADEPKTASTCHQPIQDRSKDHPSSRPTTSKRSVTSYAEASSGIDQMPAAASESEPLALDQAVAQLSRLGGWDRDSLRIVEPLLWQVPASVIIETLERALTRKARNPAGIFVHLLRIAIDEWKARQQRERLDTWDAQFGEAGIERVKREDPERYVRAWATPALEAVRPLPPALVVAHVVDYVFAYVADELERERLLKVFAAATDGIPMARAGYIQLREWTLKALDRDRLPLDQVLSTIEAMAADDETAREQLLAFAREIAANVDRERRAA